MKLRFILLLVPLVAGIISAQGPRDTIAENIKNSKNSNEKLKLYKKYADYFSTKDFGKSMRLAEDGRKLAKKTKNPTLEADFLRLKGNASYISGKLDSAGLYYYSAQELLKDQNASEVEAELYNNLGRFYRKTKDFARALKNYDRALSLYIQLNNEEGIATVYNESGVVYEYLGQHDEAVRRYRKSLEMQKKRGDLVGQGYALEFIGGNYMLQKKYDLADKYLLQSLEIRRRTRDDFALAMNFNVLAHLYQEQKKFADAEEKYLESNKISNRLQYLDLLKDNYQNLAVIYRLRGLNDRAYENLDRFRMINDSIFTLGKAKQIEELSLKYETAEKDRQLLTEKSKVLKRNVLVFSLIGVLLIGFFYYKNYQHKQKIKLQREILHQQDLAANAVMRAEDTERKRMATHLHDGIGQLLTAANMNISVLNEFKGDTKNFTVILQKTQSILAEAIADARTLSHQIMPNMLIKNSLADALRDLISKTNSPRLHINLRIDGLKKTLNQNIQVVMYRVVQECINNTIKHAHATKVEISLTQHDGMLEAIFIDDGVGFSTSHALEGEGLGLENMKSRIEMLKGSYRIESAEGAGTKIHMKIPC